MPAVIITGGARRLGKYFSRAFAKNGWDIGIIYNSSEVQAIELQTELQLTGVKCIISKADVTNGEEVRSAFSHFSSSLGDIDVLINNSGVFPDVMSLSETDEELWDKTMDINAKGAFLCSKEFSKIAKIGSRIINIGSLGALQIWKGRIPYNVSKAALLQLTKALARDLAPDISVNCINPGSIVFDEEQAKHDKTLLDSSRIPMNRFGYPSDVFDAIWFFATCSSYITGQSINIDGGYLI